MSYYLSPIGNSSQISTAGAPLNAGLIYTYLAGSSTLAATYTDNTGGTPQANPITLNTFGLPPSPIWMVGGQALKFVVKDSLGNLIRTIDGVTGVNDPAATGDLAEGSFTLSASVDGSNNLVIAVKTATGLDPSPSNPIAVTFRSATAGSGAFVTRQITAALSITIASGKTMGTANAVPSRIWAGLVDFTASTDDVRLAVMNARTSTGVTAAYDHQIVAGAGLSGLGGTAGVWFQTTNSTFSNRALRLTGYVESTQAAAGQWATAPSFIEAAFPGMKKPGDTVQCSGVKLAAVTLVTPGTTYTDVVGSSLAVTMVSTANVIRLSGGVTLNAAAVVGVNAGALGQIVRSSTALQADAFQSDILSASTGFSLSSGFGFAYLDVPGANPTYKMQAKSTDATQNISVQGYALLAEEIMA